MAVKEVDQVRTLFAQEPDLAKGLLDPKIQESLRHLVEIKLKEERLEAAVGQLSQRLADAFSKAIEEVEGLAEALGRKQRLYKFLAPVGELPRMEEVFIRRYPSNGTGSGKGHKVPLRVTFKDGTVKDFPSRRAFLREGISKAQIERVLPIV